jgi:hypothetical protein
MDFAGPLLGCFTAAKSFLYSAMPGLELAEQQLPHCCCSALALAQLQVMQDC